MLSILADRTYRHLFLAQVVALLGTGLATVALGLLAYDLEGRQCEYMRGVACLYVSHATRIPDPNARPTR